MQSLIIADFFLTMGCIFGIVVHMKRTGGTFQEVCENKRCDFSQIRRKDVT